MADKKGPDDLVKNGSTEISELKAAIVVNSDKETFIGDTAVAEALEVKVAAGESVTAKDTEAVSENVATDQNDKEEALSADRQVNVNAHFELSSAYRTLKPHYDIQMI